ncbi:hypothetical protein WMF04_01190 [Sorangium sp. So ce260]
MRQLADHAGRDACHEAVRGNIVRHHGARRHDGVLADSHASQDRGGRRDPDVLPEDDRLRQGASPPLGGLDGMIRRNEVHLRSEHHIISDIDSPDVHQMATLVDEDVLTNADVDALVRVEGRDEREARGDRPARQLAEFSPDFVGILEG